MKKILNISIFSLFVFFAIAGSALAVSGAPSPTCDIEADVINVEQTITITPPINAPSEQIVHYSC